MHKKMYVLVRKEFAPGYVAAQTNHATSKFALEHPKEFKIWNNSTIIILGVWFPHSISKWAGFLDHKSKAYSVFYEEDQNGQPTALACYDTGEIFNRLELYK